MVERSEIVLPTGSLLIICGVGWMLLNLGYITPLEFIPVIMILFGACLFFFASILGIGRLKEFSSKPSDLALLALFLVFGGYIYLLYVQGLINESWLVPPIVGFCGAMIILLEFRRRD